MANKTQQIIIDSILGGISQYTHASPSNQYLGGIGINPNLSVPDGLVNPIPFMARKSGTITPQGATRINSVTTYPIVHMTSAVKENDITAYVYAYDAGGSLYTVANTTVTAIADGGTLSGGSHATGNGGSSGNGMAYYDNYLYLAKNTTIARYGPLNGTPAFDGDYWGTTLSKPALSDTSIYPTVGNIEISNHQMHRHSDGRLYFFDINGGLGTIHYIQTSKTTVEGDTNNGSTYGALTLGYGLIPTAIASYGELIAIACYEGNPGVIHSAISTRPKIYFWDGVSTNANNVVWFDVPGTYITAMANIAGALYVFSGVRPYGGVPGEGVTISRYLGGIAFEQVFKTYGFTPPLQSSVWAQDDSIVFGTTVFYDNPGTSTRSGLFRVNVDGSIHGVCTSASTGSSHTIASIHPVGFSPYEDFYFSTFGGNYINKTSDDCSATYGSGFFLSQIYNIGKKFKITKIEMNLSNFLDADQSITVSVWRDNATEASDIHTLTTINSTNYPNKKKIIFKPVSLTGEYNFFVKIEWTGASASGPQPSIILPLYIEYELISE